MRNIAVSTEVFARIWSQRREGEEDENAILMRLLGVKPVPKAHDPQSEDSQVRVRWRDDVRSALKALGGKARLADIYGQVRRIRLEQGRTVPVNCHAIIRRELEQNCRDTSAFTGERDWFRSVDGIGQGVWALQVGAE